jgi:hypothetical protein
MSAFNQEKTVTIAVGVDLSDKFAVHDFQRGSFRATAVTSAAINFDVSNDGLTWETLALASGAAFADLPAPAVNLPRILPAALFSFRYARFNLAGNQAGVPAVLVLNLSAN